jgi:hypothetical protein
MFQKHLQINASAYVPTDFLQQDVGTFFTRHLLDLNRAVRKLTFTRTTGVRNEDVGEVRLKRLPSGFSGALVFQMTAYTNTQFPCVQAILKIALNKNRIAVDALERELTNYRAYVRWYLPYHWRPELLGEVSEGSMKVICYAFVSSDDEPFQTLATLIAKGNYVAIDAVIDSVFQPKFQRWYHRDNNRRL